MDRRNFLRIASGALAIGRMASLEAADTISLGLANWELELPADWRQVKKAQTYFQAPDEAAGCYLKLIEHHTRESVKAFARSIQEIHESSFRALRDLHWKTMSKVEATEGDFYRSVLDLYDSEKAYRVASVVLASRDDAIQVTLHDYDCEDYERSRSRFESTLQSVRRSAGAA
jgi:hypothetical protein